jgi:hypothetical protein
MSPSIQTVHPLVPGLQRLAPNAGDHVCSFREHDSRYVVEDQSSEHSSKQFGLELAQALMLLCTASCCWLVEVRLLGTPERPGSTASLPP